MGLMILDISIVIILTIVLLTWDSLFVWYYDLEYIWGLIVLILLVFSVVINVIELPKLLQ